MAPPQNHHNRNNRNNRNNRDQNRSQQDNAALDRFSQRFESSWIAHKMVRDATDFAKDFGKHVQERKLTTTQIRGFFNELKSVENQKGADRKSNFLLLLPKLAYAAKRNADTGTKHFAAVVTQAHRAVDTEGEDFEAQFTRFRHFIEAILAYHIASGGK